MLYISEKGVESQILGCFVELQPFDGSFDVGSSISYEQAKHLRDEAIWQQLQTITVGFALEEWLATFSKLTSKNYRYGMRRLMQLGLVDVQSSLQAFSLVNHDSVVDRIKLVEEWSESSKQARAACYISFTRFLSRRTQGMVKRAIPSREGHNKTFFKVREKVMTNAMDRSQWSRFMDEIDRINIREGIVARLALQGGKRVSEVLRVQTDDILWEDRKISYRHSKTKGLEKYTLITYPEPVITSLSNYLGGRKGTVFVTRSGRDVDRRNVWASFVKAGERAGIPFRVTPHVLRASCITYLKNQGFSDSDIMVITGHASAEMVNAYDKRDTSDNISAKISLV